MQTLSAVQGVLGQCEAGPWGFRRVALLLWWPRAHTHTLARTCASTSAAGSRRTHGLDAGRPFRRRGRPLWWGPGIGGRGYGFISQRVALPSSFPSLLFKSPLDAAELELSPLHELWAPHRGLPKAPQKQLVTVTSLSLVWEKQRRHATNRVLSLCLSSRKGGTVRKALAVSGH